jgi:CTP synthase (UTP-ammonia lyase)
MPTRIALLGDKDLTYVTHRALEAAVALLPDGIAATWVGTDTPAARALDGFDGIWALPGTPYRDDAAALAAISAALDAGTPLLGTCGGFQYAALALLGPGAVHAEVDPDAADPVVAPLACTLVGEEREVTAVPGTRLAAICGTAPFTGFHYCRYGLSDAAVDRLEAAGAVIAAHAPDAGVEAFEVPGHPFFVATLFQPQMSAVDGALHPLITAFAEEAARVRMVS